MKRSIANLVVLLAAPLALALTGCDGPELCAQVARDAGFPQSSMVTAVAIGMAESGCKPDATGTNPASGSCPHGSRDRGLWQINSCWHPEVSDECAYDPNCNAKEALRISNGGTDWSPWSAYKNGSYKQFLDEAEQAVGN
ncbi:hypothetical protein [Nannocystis sp. SCPEA4]|uniref:hypothetical protein n=1 Tax=Nannocystis sp. SCPEA4 TaxID=2996787 RepID=UPI00226FC630|nr:hypothetical protein [Nannocystis sp. SCPEA4]MCY1059118.1 hypothetical protein [Nannocystis sp. SCPEA4]